MRLITTALLLLSATLFAATLTVDNYRGGGQYSTIQNAINAASDDDVILVSPSPNEYEGFTCNKRLKIIGGGIHATGNVFTPESTLLLYRTDVELLAGSQGSVIEGFGGQFEVFISDDDIHLYQLELASIINDTDPILNGGHVIKNSIFSGSPYSSHDYRIGQFSSITVLNSVFVGYGSSACHVLDYANGYSSIVNCICMCDISYSRSSISTPTIVNCYLNNNYGHTAEFPDSPNFMYNICSGDYLEGDTNLNNIPFDTVFDEDYYPITNSPAIDAGHPDPGYNDLDGTRNDIGIYGGPLPFKPDGCPNLPTIRELNGTMVTSPAEGLEINVRATSE